TYGDEDRLCAFYRNTINAFGMLLQATAKVKRVIAYRAALDDKGEGLKIIAFSLAQAPGSVL
ncbi:hypothetical protein ACSRCJ_30005, partial [Salmonella enterica]